ncbi:two pore calcium channel protein 1-like protein [Leptotrombidium deliense]|uniref:Two pore calcium channel protein 1-like protein n=1 Tax=Leptotrombidium deliense TaxID=299467 RepID=A0A443S9T0_9ACAR|nr:two pore calcium channel protein 1-like protein [Leptotrombidium deliense]
MVIEMNNLQEFGEKEEQQKVEIEPVANDGEIRPCADIPNEFSSSYAGTWNRRASVNIDLLFDSDSDEFQKTWNMNYNEAAIYLEEGKNNDKFQYHPRSQDALPAYLIVHNRYFYALDFVASLLLLGLAIVEQPSVALFKVSPGFHASMELLLLSVVSVELCMKLRWMKIKPFLSHTRTIIKMVTLIVMITEALVVLIRLDPHFRVTRALRPIFLIDNHYCGGIRRVIRQILQSLPPIIDMLLLLLFFMLIFSLFGFYLFSPNGEDSYFSSLERSFVSLFVLLTTAKYTFFEKFNLFTMESSFPDVMMPSYAKCRWSAIFFVLFLVIHLYFLMNLVSFFYAQFVFQEEDLSYMLAVVYETFTRMDKIKFKKLLLHRRVACKHAFRLLVSRNNPSEIKFKHFYGLMRYFKPNATKLEVYLIFKTLDTNESHSLTIEEFHRIYEISQLKWEQKESTKYWYSIIKWKFLQRFFDVVRSVVSSVWFEALVNLMITLSLLWQIFSLSIYSLSAETTWDQFFKQSKVMLFFVTFSVVVSFGLFTYFSSFWNVFDLIVTTTSIFGYISNLFGVSVAFVFILRSFRLLKLFQLKKRYRDIMGTFIFIMAKRFGSVAVVVLVVYYFFAIVGMEIFSGVDLRNCCKQTAVEQYFVAGDGKKNGYYYLNNFDNIAISFVTLFELMVVNNWFILMDGYAYTTTEWSRLYFMFFYIITMVVVTVVVAFVLDAFLFRIQFKREIGECNYLLISDEMITAIVCLSGEEIAFCTDVADQRLTINESANYEFVFRGYRMRSRFSFNLKMYAEEVKQWIHEANAEEQLDTSFGDSVNSVAKSRRTVSCSY